MDPQPPLILIVAVKEPTNSVFRYYGHNCAHLIMDLLRSYTTSTFPMVSPGSVANAVRVSSALAAEVVLCISNPFPEGVQPFDFQGNLCSFLRQALWDYGQAAGVDLLRRTFVSDVVVMAPNDTMHMPGRNIEREARKHRPRNRSEEDEGDQVVPVKRFCGGENGAFSIGRGGDGSGSSGGVAFGGGNL